MRLRSFIFLLAVLAPPSLQAEGMTDQTASTEPAEATDPTETVTDSAFDLRCVVNGYDVAIINDGPESQPVGTSLAWEVAFARMQGTLVLTRPLDPDNSTFITAALGSSYLNTRTPCIVSIAPMP